MRNFELLFFFVASFKQGNTGSTHRPAPRRLALCVCLCLCVGVVGTVSRQMAD